MSSTRPFDPRSYSMVSQLFCRFPSLSHENRTSIISREKKGRPLEVSSREREQKTTGNESQNDSAAQKQTIVKRSKFCMTYIYVQIIESSSKRRQEMNEKK